MQEAFERAARESQSDLAEKIIVAQEELKRFEEAKVAFRSVGSSFYLLTFVPTAAALTGLKRESLNEKWQGLKHQLPGFTNEQQSELIEQVAHGMGISQERIDPLYKKAHSSAGPLANSDHFVTSMALLCGYTPDQRRAFYNVMRIRKRLEGKQLSSVCAAIANWLSVNPQ